MRQLADKYQQRQVRAEGRVATMSKDVWPPVHMHTHRAMPCWLQTSVPCSRHAAQTQATMPCIPASQWETVSRELAAATAASAAAAAATAGGAEAPLANGGGHMRPPLACLQRYQMLLAETGKEAPKMDSTAEGIARLAPLVA